MKRNKLTRINFWAGLGSQIIILILGLVVPKLVLNNYGSDTNGLTSTIMQIFAYMALLEAGISASTKNALYLPLKNRDKDKINYWLSVSKYQFKHICYIYLLFVIILSFLLPITLKTNVDYWTIFIYTLFEGLTSVVSFYFINTWTCLLFSNGETYIINIFTFITKVLSYALKITLSLYTINIAFIQVGYFIVSLIQLLLYYLYMKKNYPWIQYVKVSNMDKLPDKNSYIISEICYTIFSSTDMIVLSVFVSTALASVYSVYNMVYVSLNALCMAIFNALSYNLGQAFHESKEKVICMYDSFNSFFMATITCLMCISLLLIKPFVELYTDGVTDIKYIYEYLPLLFCLIQMLSWGRFNAGVLIGIAGFQKKVVKINVIEALINLTFSIVLVNLIGITGVVLATVIALPLKLISLNKMADKLILNRSCIRTIKILFTNYLAFLITFFFSKVTTIAISNYYMFVLWGVVFSTTIIPIIFGINYMINKKMFFLFKQK